MNNNSITSIHPIAAGARICLTSAPLPQYGISRRSHAVIRNVVQPLYKLRTLPSCFPCFADNANNNAQLKNVK